LSTAGHGCWVMVSRSGSYSKLTEGIPRPITASGTKHDGG
jgi:hypothetical protein